MSDVLEELSAAGVAIWLDDLSRARLTSGSLAQLIADRHVVGVTTNPAIFHAAIAGKDDYADQLATLAAQGGDAAAAVRAMTTADVRDACTLLRGAYEASNGVDGRVSIEVDPFLAHDTAATIAQARELWDEVGQDNAMIKIPATVEGLPAITAVLAEGISVNVTLIFSVDRYDQVMDAFFAGIEAALEAGRDVSRLASVASFFVSRVDTEIDRRLDAMGTAEATALRGAAAVANARLAYARHVERFSSSRWELLAASGALAQRPLWASTSVKDPSLPSTLYVAQLVAPGTVNTMPEATLTAMADEGQVTPGTAASGAAEAAAHFAALERLGIGYGEVTELLETEGVDKFTSAWSQLLDAVDAALAARR